ncbi:alpha/beta fold hydrolase [Aurantimonas endophytica]|uniref:Alpha-beta hydrolase superfamily lysophospholipase n=1 Tax=Aurantimonas endophytica TaxID=1522175 RepID=A0A7W6MNX8_9HYPH|nr:alpha/beta hydrolase [Aurantimonas endophytica]MBB4002345.1 alpha-beta hydrolase superfamily lysophospholipase [Aurantimonas endophytica]MCO6402031.1 alpha/beta fold hydrolase [Aurantimonas endophytica]
MFDDQFTIDSRSGAAVHVYSRKAVGAPRGIVLIFHGLAEHAGRYARLAGELADAGYHVFAHDHRGHGSTVAADAVLRRFARKGGAEKVMLDCRAVHAEAIARCPGLPVAVFGHSMGGIIAMNYAQRHGGDLAALAVWNADLSTGLEERVGRAALKVEKALKGSDVPSRLIQRATFEAWGKAIEPRRTMFDWLSHDPLAVDAYIADPLCGFSPSISMMEDVLSLMFQGGSEAGLSMLPGGLPVHLLAGTGDPATGYGEAARQLAGRLRLAGSHDVTVDIADGARHETLHEIEPWRGAAVTSLLAWLHAKLPG